MTCRKGRWQVCQANFLERGRRNAEIACGSRQALVLVLTLGGGDQFAKEKSKRRTPGKKTRGRGTLSFGTTPHRRRNTFLPASGRVWTRGGSGPQRY